jgi:hypothetical protein
MLTDSVTLEHFTDADIRGLRKIWLQLIQNEQQLGGWSDKTQVNQGGCQLNIKYEKKGTVTLDGSGSSNRFVHILMQSPEMLAQLCAKLFDYDADRDEAELIAASKEV